MKKLSISLVLLTLSFVLAQPAEPPVTVPAKLVPWLTIQVKDFGEIVVELFPDDAPLNVRNVETLAAQGFYDGLTFHRVVPGFVIQGGDPTGTGMGGPDYTVPAEIKRKHVRGGFAMARTNNPQKASSSCQFYINLRDLPELDGNYTVIGQVRSGMEVVDAIAQVQCDKNDKPLKPVVMEKITVELKPPTPQTAAIPEHHFLNILFKDYGRVRVQLFPEDAPLSVERIEDLANGQFYDSVPLKEVRAGAWIQAGDRNTAPGGPGCQGCCPDVPAEFKHRNLRGAVGVGQPARGKPARAACEFYFLLADQPQLDEAGYTVIGKVVEGMDILEKIAKVKVNNKYQPVKPVVISSVTVQIIRPSQD